MASAKPEVHINLLVDKLKTKFSAGSQVINEIPMATLMFSRSGISTVLLEIPIHVTGSRKSNMAGPKAELCVTQLVDKLST